MLMVCVNSDKLWINIEISVNYMVQFFLKIIVVLSPVVVCSKPSYTSFIKEYYTGFVCRETLIENTGYENRKYRIWEQGILYLGTGNTQSGNKKNWIWEQGIPEFRNRKHQL